MPYYVLSCLYTTTGMPVRINNPDDFVYDSVIDGVSGLKLLRVFSMPLKVSTVCTARTVHLLRVIRGVLTVLLTHCLSAYIFISLYLSDLYSHFYCHFYSHSFSQDLVSGRVFGVINFINKYENDIFTGGDEMIIRIFARQVLTLTVQYDR